MGKGRGRSVCPESIGSEKTAMATEGKRELSTPRWRGKLPVPL